MKIGYARVSTVKQGKEGFSLDDQREKLIKAGAEKVYADTFTGTKINRPEFDKLMNEIQEGDELIVCKLDRLARSAGEGCVLIQQLQARGIIVNVLNMGRADNTPMGKLMTTMLLAFSEFERDLIIERTQTGKQRARESGVRVDGRPLKFSEAKLNHALDLIHDGHSYTEVVEMTGISKSTLIRAERKWKAANIDIQDGELIPLNISDALWQTDPDVYVFLHKNPTYTITLKNELQEISELTAVMVEEEISNFDKIGKAISDKRKIRDEKLDQLVVKVIAYKSGHA